MVMIGNWRHPGCSLRAVKRQRQVVGRQRRVYDHFLRFVLPLLTVVQFWSSYKKFHHLDWIRVAKICSGIH